MELTTIIIIKGGFFSLSLSLSVTSKECFTTALHTATSLQMDHVTVELNIVSGTMCFL